MAKDLFGIAALLIGVAFAALLVGHASGASEVIRATGGTFNQLLQTVELAGGGGYGGYAGFQTPYQYGGS